MGRQNHRHRKALHGILAHPLDHNPGPRAVEHVPGEIGAPLAERREGMAVSAPARIRSRVMRPRRLISAAGIGPARDSP